jgi:GT2 family glycosyltransferase
MDVSIIVVSYNTEQLTYDCVQSVMDSETKYTFELIVVDNNSADNTVERLKKDFPTVHVVASSENLGFSRGNNTGISVSSGNYILLLNSDTLLFKDSLENLLQVAIAKDYDIVGPVLLNKDLSIQRSWFNFPSALKTFLRLTDMYLLFYKFSRSFLFKIIYFFKKPAFMVAEIKEDTPMDYLTFACILINSKVIAKIGNLDEKLFFYQEDCEYGLRAKKNNYQFIYSVSSRIIHLGGSSSSKFSWFAFENDVKGILHIFKKHYSKNRFIQVKFCVLLALQIRIFFLRFGYFNQIKKSGLYEGKNIEIPQTGEYKFKYKELYKYVKSISFS